MLVFVDESGDPGFKLGKGSSDLFVLTLVVFIDNHEAQVADQEIDLIRTALRLKPLEEFKFNKLSDRGRRYFLEAVSELKFEYYSVVIDKKQLVDVPFTLKESFYNQSCSLAFNNCKEILVESTVVIDGSGSREFRQQLQKYLKDQINDKNHPTNSIKKVKIEDSKRNNLLQLADMVCGAVARSLVEKRGGQKYRSLISKREKKVQFWPK